MKNTKTKAVMGILAVLLVLAGVIAGCGDDAETTTTALAAATDSTGAAADTETADASGPGNGDAVGGGSGNGAHGAGGSAGGDSAAGSQGAGGTGGGSGSGGSGKGGAEAGADHPAPDLAAGPLSSEEQEALLYLAEEEKLAHDVYVALYDMWGTKVFDNISASETQHMESMQALLANYGLADPIADSGPGVFSNAELQQLYEALVAQGGASKTEALAVGVAIETKDIEDLEDLLGITTHSDIEEVAQNLLAGSKNHLAAFSRAR